MIQVIKRVEFNNLSNILEHARSFLITEALNEDRHLCLKKHTTYKAVLLKYLKEEAESVFCQFFFP